LEEVSGYADPDDVQKPDVSACALGVHAALHGVGKARVGANGNSFSGPQIAGCAALLLEANPNLKPWDIQHIINTTAVDLGDKGWDPMFGWGRMDCHAAAKMALGK